MRTTRRGVIVLVAATLGLICALAACAGPVPRAATLPAGTSAQTVTTGGAARTFLLHRPPRLPAGARVPLVVMLHGGGGNARAAEERYGWDAAADRDGLLVAYPDGVGGSWNGGGGCCGPAARTGADDVGFLSAMIATIGSTTPVDPDRVYATGISEGGIMSYRLACSTTLFAAIAPDSATLLGPCPEPAPTSLLAVHGGADTRIPFDGRPGAGPNAITGGPVSDVVAGWRAVDRCAPPSLTTAGPVHTTAADCPGGRAVALVVIDGAGHQWPGGVPGGPTTARGLAADPPSTALDATATISAFFRAHPRSAQR